MVQQTSSEETLLNNAPLQVKTLFRVYCMSAYAQQ